jgi:hypothetical protein
MYDDGGTGIVDIAAGCSRRVCECAGVSREVRRGAAANKGVPRVCTACAVSVHRSPREHVPSVHQTARFHSSGFLRKQRTRNSPLTYAHTQTRAHTHTHTHTQAHTLTRTHKHTHAHIHTHTRAHAPTCETAHPLLAEQRHILRRATKSERNPSELFWSAQTATNAMTAMTSRS